MKDIILITGANGHLAQSLLIKLKEDYSIRLLTTDKELSKKESYFYWNVKEKYLDNNALKNCNHIIHLAGYSIMNRWSKSNKAKMYESRVDSAKLLFNKCKTFNIKIDTFISASAIGIYKTPTLKAVGENGEKGNSWISKMAIDWEYAADEFKNIGSRIVKMRLPLIFNPNSGFLKYNLLSMKWGIGIALGDYNRKINWVHTNDVVRFIQMSIKNKKIAETYNLSSGSPISQIIFLKEIKRILYPFSIIIRIPMKLARLFLGERTEVIEIDIEPKINRSKEEGFSYKTNILKKILKNIKSEDLL